MNRNYPQPTRSLIILLIDFLFVTHLLFSQEIIWEHTGGPMGGVVGDIAINSKGDVYAGVYGYTGLYKSTDNGDSWEHIVTQFEDFEVYAIYITEEDYIFVGTNFQGRVYRSTDDGVTWENIREGYNTGECWAFGQSKDGMMFAGDGQHDKLFRSTDYGNNWELSANLSSLVFITDSNNTVYCGTFDGLFFTTDNGITWEENEYFSSVPVSTILIDDNNGIYCGTGYYDNGNGVYYSTDGGGNWKQLGLEGKVVLSLAFNSDGHLYAGTLRDGLFFTDDMGNTWQNYTNGLYRKQVFRLEVNREDDIFVGSENEGVFRSTNGGELFSQIGLPTSKVSNIIFSGDSLIFASTPSGVQKYRRKTKQWSNMGLQHVQEVAFAPNGDLFAATGDLSLFVSDVAAGLFRSTNNGESWSIVAFEDTTIWNVLITNKKIIYTLTGEGLMYSYDYGSSWEALPYYSDYWSRALEEGANGEIYFTAVGVGGYSLYRRLSVNSTIDTLISGLNLLLNESLYVQNNAIYIADAIGGGWGDIYRSTDSGINWENVVSGIQAYCIYRNNKGITYAGSFNGLLYSTDFGDTWINIAYPIQTYGYIREIKLDMNNNLFFGTMLNGLFEADIITVVGNEENPQIPKEFLLSQNYPNPFNPVTTINYSISIPAFITLKVYDILGKEVASLVNEEKPAGSYSVKFSTSDGGRNLANGIYIYRLTAGKFTDSKKLILLK